MPTDYTHYLVTWIAADLRGAAIAGLAEAAQVDVTSYPARLERLAVLDGLDLAPNLLVADAYADWSACRPQSLAAFLAVARETCGVGVYTEVDGVHTYVGTGGAWQAWPRLSSAPSDTQHAQLWLAAQGWQRASEVVI